MKTLASKIFIHLLRLHRTHFRMVNPYYYQKQTYAWVQYLFIGFKSKNYNERSKP